MPESPDHAEAIATPVDAQIVPIQSRPVAPMLSPISPTLAGYENLVPFPGHWDGYLQGGVQSLFREGRLDEAIRGATLRLEERLRELCGAPPDRIGVDLVGDAFKPSTGFLEPIQLPMAEREGLHQLFRGAVQQIRNPVGHRTTQPLPTVAYDTIAFINYLLNLASDAALTRYVYPYVGRWAQPALILNVRKRDIDGDGHDEVIVMVRTQTDSREPAITALVLRDGGNSSLDGTIPLIPGSIAALPIFEDLDGDGLPEIIIAAGDNAAGGTWVWHGMVVSSSRSGTLAVFGGFGQMTSTGVPFEVLRPMSWTGPVVAGRTPSGRYDHWAFDDRAGVVSVDIVRSVAGVPELRVLPESP